MSQPHPDPIHPSRIGRYEIVEQLASGGMATVYLARVTGPGGFRKLFALKTIHRHLASETGFIEMFLDEARLASRISHPNICEVVDFGVGAGSYFIVMELLLGEPLNKVRPLLRNAVSPTTGLGLATRIVCDAADGLHAAHEATDDDGAPLHVVHRDVSHSNIFVTFDGTAKVVDFGIASAADQLHLTRSGTLKGKIAYMSPEQVEQQTVDRRADVWALGVVLWELITNRSLFRHKRQVDTMRAVLELDIPAPSTIRADVPPSLDRLVASALSRDPQTRFPTAGAFAEALRETQQDEGWAISARDLSEEMQRISADSYARQSDMVARARRGSAEISPHEQPRASSSEQPTVGSPRAVSVEQESTETRVRSWKTPLALLAGVALMIGAYAAGSATSGPELVTPTDSRPTDAIVPPERTAPPEPPVSPPTNDREPPESTPTLATTDSEPPIARTRRETPPAISSTMIDETPRPAKVPRQPPRARTGFVNVTTPGGWAEVSTSGRRLGRSPLRARLPTGRHHLVLRPFGRGAVRRTVTVRARQVSRVVVPVTAP